MQIRNYLPHFTKYTVDDREAKAEFENSPWANKITQDYLKDLNNQLFQVSWQRDLTSKYFSNSWN